ncbi:hypothetical protein [Tepidanaerobacter sp. GT38]|uniref:hypothetical protein n=1 Tax=Tepidanaerobacter sp. GT38 TaxID=2722793 RepID=UPI001F25C029
MRILLSENDIQLLKAIRPFMSGKSQELLDLLLVTINVFQPNQPDQKINYEALNTLLTMVHDSIQAKKSKEDVIEIDEYEHVQNEQAENVENLLNVLAESKNNDD